MPEKKPKEEPAIVDDVLLADGSKAAARLTALRTAKAAEAGAPNDDTPDWRATCAICLDLLPVDGARQKTCYFGTRARRLSGVNSVGGVLATYVARQLQANDACAAAPLEPRLAPREIRPLCALRLLRAS
jgi:hypothetical protein